MAEDILTMQNQVVKHPDVKGYDADGKPIFKKHIRDVSIITKRETKADKIMFTSVFIIFLIQSLTLIAPVVLMFMLAIQYDPPFDVWAFDYSKGVFFRYSRTVMRSCESPLVRSSNKKSSTVSNLPITKYLLRICGTPM